jgi:multisubunit Na+/H+ antiporter MnhB subunit
LHKTHRDDDTRLTPARMLILALAIVLALATIAVVFALPADQPRLSEAAAENLPATGLLNPVTAVLLNFRGYDTLLEVAVLFLAVLGIWSMARTARVWLKVPDSPVLTAFVRLLLPLMIIIAGYLLWLGADAPGGAFQGGAVLGGMGVLWIAATIWLPKQRLRFMLRLLLIIGLTAFIVVGLLLLLIEGAFLQYPPEQAKALILLIESAATVSIGITLMLLFLGGIPERQDD